jgi:hypothetical protein
MANSDPHPLDPDSKLNPEERVLFTAIHGDADDAWAWSSATVATTTVTQLHAIGAHVCVGRDCPHDTHRDPLPDAALARSGDPVPSQVAAASIDNMAERHRAVLQVARTFADAFTYDELIWRYEKKRSAVYPGPDVQYVEDLPAMEPQSIRSRCAELRRAGWIEQAGRALSDAGRACNTWRVVA